MKRAELLAEQERLLQRAKEMAKEHWGVTYTGTLRLIDTHWKSVNGGYVGIPYKGIAEIRMSAQRNAERSPEDVERTLLHELVHWRQHSQGLPARDTDYEFIAECLRVGASISQSTKAQAAYERYHTEAMV